MYSLPSVALRQVPTQVIGAASVPGGQVVTDPPQHAHRNPSIAQ